MDRPEIFAVDFDGTLSLNGQWPECGEPNRELISFLLQKQAQGAKIILWTCRCDEALKTALLFCARYGLIFDAVNENLPELIELYGNDCRKINADYYIDDKAVNVLKFFT